MNIEHESKRCLSRIISQLDDNQLSQTDQKVFIQRLEKHFPRLFGLMFTIYGHKYDFYYYLQQLVITLEKGFAARSQKLKQKDRKRFKDPHWYKHESMLGMACYVDLFAGDLSNLINRIPYLKSLGVTFLHLLPLYKAPEGDSDGGYAVSDYRKVNPQLGTTNDLKKLAKVLAENDISLVLDFVFNHTSEEHRWAQAAKAGDNEYQEYYYMFDDKHTPNQYEQNLREIFPQVRRGNFTFNEEANKWVWTTFNSFQWDLNYTNPAVFNAITEEMLFLANLGCESLRLDALAFIWKDMGTDCENRPKAHTLIQAFNACLQIVAPAVVFKSEAIVHPDEVTKYIDKEECQLSYNPLLMALIWNSLATRKVKLLTESMRKSFPISTDCAWVNYIRCHDDIGWTFDDDVANQLGINGHDHRLFLNRFYTGRFEGSFAKGVAFGENPSTGDCRVCGSLASLAGLEQAIEAGAPKLTNNAIKRILMVHAIILGIGGIPLLYSGDELGLLNDYSYRQDKAKKHDDRWVHRIAISPQAIAQTQQKNSPQGQIAQGLQHLIEIRKANPIFGDSETHILDSGNQHVFAFKRLNEQGEVLLALYNFSEHSQQLSSHIINHLGSRHSVDLMVNKPMENNESKLTLGGYQVIWWKA